MKNLWAKVKPIHLVIYLLALMVVSLSSANLQRAYYPELNYGEFFGISASAQDFHETILRPVTGHRVNYTTTSATTQLDITCCDSSGIRIIRVIASSDAFMAIAASDYTTSAFSADQTTGILLPSFIPEYFKVNPGAQIAVVASSISGQLYITEMSP